jgi:hypothetical protein
MSPTPTTIPATGQTPTSVSTTPATTIVPTGMDTTGSCAHPSLVSTATTVVGRLTERVTVPLTAARLAVTGFGSPLFLGVALACVVVGAAFVLAPHRLVAARPGHHNRRIGHRAPFGGRRSAALSRTPRLSRRRPHRHRSRNVWRY